MTASLHRRTLSPPAEPLDDEDLLSEILLRLPPQPSSLPRASLVCRRWRSLASAPGFCRRFRRHHRHNPPLLGYFEMDNCLSFVPSLESPNRVPPGRFSLQRGHGDDLMCLGCRHGLFLIFNITANQMLVWDPVTGDQHRLAIPPGLAAHAEKTSINGAVLRAAEDAHFQVVLTVTDNDDEQHRRGLAYVYLSETGVWDDLISTQLPSKVPMSTAPALVIGKPAVLAGDSLYWMLAGNFVGILEFDLVKQSLAVIQGVHMLEEGNYQFCIEPAEGGGLGLLFMTGSSIQLWKRKTDCDSVASWGLGRTIDLDKLFSLNLRDQFILGFAEENKVSFLWTYIGIFMVHLESLLIKKLSELDIISQYHPFESCYTAETGIDDEHDAADLLHHT